MTIGKILLVVFFIVLASGSLAQIDLDPDGIGIYFDQGANIVSTTAPEGTHAVTAYLILTNPSLDGILDHWSLYVSTYFDTPGQNAVIWGDPYNGINISTNMPGSEHFHFNVWVNPEPPYPTGEVTLLAELEILPVTFTEPINIFVWEGAFYSVSDVGGAFMNPSSGDWSLPVAVINGPSPVALEPHSWGEVKSLFWSIVRGRGKSL
jgi:hypothetical protein